LKQQWQPLDVRECHKEQLGQRQRLKRVLGEYWQEINRWSKLEKEKDPKPREAEMHDQAGIGDRIWSAELVSDDTASTFIVRAEIDDHTLEDAKRLWKMKMQTALEEKDESQNVHGESKSEDMTQLPRCLEHKPHLLLSSRGSLKYDIFYLRSSPQLKFRAQARLLLINVGFHLGNFLDLLELLQAIRGAVKGTL
jgi:hypothetical protein